MNHPIPCSGKRELWSLVVVLSTLLLGVANALAAEVSRLQTPQPLAAADNTAVAPAASSTTTLPGSISANVLAVVPDQAAAALAEKPETVQTPPATSPAASKPPPPVVTPAATAPAVDTKAAPVTPTPTPTPAPAVTTAPAKTEDKLATSPAAEKTAKSLLPAPKGDIIINSDTMDMSLANHTTTFSGHVSVTDGNMRLTADRMIVLFGEDNRPRNIEATGNVLILQPELKRKAKAGKASYDIVSGSVTLTEEPVLTTDRNALSGAEKIIYNRDTQSAKTEGGKPVIIIVPEDENSFKDINILNGRKKDGN